MHRFFFTRLILCLLPVSVSAQSVPSILSVTPNWIQRGSEVEVTIVGQHISADMQFLIDGDPGLSITNIPSTALTTSDDNMRTFRMRLRAQPNASISQRELRVLSPAGVSGPVKIHVGQWPEIQETEPNNKREEAQPIQPPATLRGAIQQPKDQDIFKFQAGKDEVLVFEVVAARRESALRPLLTIHDASGKKLAENADRLGRDSLIRFKAPNDGTYYLGIRDTRQQGGQQFNYQIHAGPVLYLESIFPLGGLASPKPFLATEIPPARRDG